MILVTGASGLIGGNLVRALLEKGQSVRALVHEDRRAIAGLDVEAIQADVRDPEAVLRALRGVDVTYHLAGSISLEMDTWEQMRAINVLGTRNVVDACLQRGVRRLIHFSTIHALNQEPLDEPVDESRPLVDAEAQPGWLNPFTPPYDLSKAQGEREVQAGLARGLDAVILNPTAVLGPWDFKPSYLGQALVLIARGRIPALVRGGFDWVDVRDVVAGAIRAELAAPCGSRYLLGGHWHSVREVAELAAAAAGRSAPIFTVPTSLAGAAAPLVAWLARFAHSAPIYTRVTLRALRSNRQISQARAVQELGYRARPLAETVQDTMGWFQSHGYL